MTAERAPLGRALAVAVAALATLFSGGAAQSTEELVNLRRLEYNQAREEYEASESAFRVVERQFSTALEAVGRARRAGDEDALERAYALTQDRSGPLQARDQRVEATQERLDRARQALIDIITVRLEELLAQMDAAASAQQRASLDALFRDLSNELQTLEAEAADAFSFNPVVLPEVTFDPRDGPEELEAKAQLLERRAAVADTVILQVDDEIQSLEDRLRIERQRQDFLAGTDRFDDTRVPVVVGGPAGERPTAADSAGTARRPQTLEERIESLQGYREQLESYRDQLLIRADQFRRRLGFVA